MSKAPLETPEPQQTREELTPPEQLEKDWQVVERLAGALMASLRRHASMRIWRDFFSAHIFVWNFIFLMFALSGLGFTMIGLQSFFGPQSLFYAEVCFAVAAFIILMKVAQFTVTTNYPVFQRVIFTFVMFGLVGVGIVELIRAIQSHRPRQAARTDVTQTGAVEGLSRLGWTVKPEADHILFEIASKPLPPMKESADYFRQLHKPFRLHFQSIKDIQGLHELADIPECTKIEINAGEFTDISELRGFSNLTTLIITQTPISGLETVDLSPLSELTNLRELNLGSTKATSIAPISKLTELRKLNLRGVPIRDLSPIANLHKLESVDVTETGVTSLSPLRNAKDLNELGVGGKQVADLATLKELGNLKRLVVIEQEVFDLSPIGELPNLESLFIWGLPVFNLSPLRKLVKLQDVQLSGIGFVQPSVVVDVAALGDLKDLKKLTLGELQISDLSFVSSLKNLVEINIGMMPVSSIEPLRGLTSLERVSLNSTLVTDISPLLDLPALNSLSVIRTPARSDMLSELERRGVKIQR